MKFSEWNFNNQQSFNKCFKELLSLVFFAGIAPLACSAQELFVFTNPASNIAARSLSLNLSQHHTPYDRVYDRPANRFAFRTSAGLTKKLMLSVGTTISNMHTYKTKFESVFAETKFRFLSHDEVHRHFRMAAFLRGAYNYTPFHSDELNLLGDKTGLEAGIIATQLLHRFAISGSVSHVQSLNSSRFTNTVYVPKHLYQGMIYSLSTGYLLLPRTYSSYKQVNVNLYAELLGQQTFELPLYFIDAAPAIQLIFFSTTRLNFGYRFQLAGTSERMSKTSWTVGIERTLFNVWKGKRTD